MDTWVAALSGGVLIGLAATWLLWFNGRIAGVSGIVGGVLAPWRGDVLWRVAFLVGLVVAAGAYLFFVPGAFKPRVGFPRGALIAAGLLVGFGSPGPAVAGLGVGSIETLWFVPAMVAGMLLHRAVRGRTNQEKFSVHPFESVPNGRLRCKPCLV